MRETKKKDGCDTCAKYTKNILKFLLSHIGLVSLVVGYTIIGAFTFEKLESEHEIKIKKNITSIRLKVTEDLWAISERVPFFQEHDWAESARKRLKAFEQDLIRAMKNDGWDGSEDLNTQQWTFAGALFYSIILITTIGYGHIAPKTSLGKVVTIFYAIPGVPLMMLCLANIGDGMAHSFRFLYWKVCCYACTKKPKKKRRKGRPRSRYPSSQRPARSSSFRRSLRLSQRSQDSHMSDSAFFGYPQDPEYNSRMYPESNEMRGSAYLDPQGRDGSQRPMRPEENPARSSSKGGGVAPVGKGGIGGEPQGTKRSSENSNRSGDRLDIPHPDEDDRGNVLFNKYAIDKDGGFPEDNLPPPMQQQRGRSPLPGSGAPGGDPRADSKPSRDRSHERSGDRMREPEILVTRAPRSPIGPRAPLPRNAYPESPSMGPTRDSAYYSRHLPPPDPRNSRLSRLEEDYYDDEYYYEEDDDDDDDDDEDAGDKPVPIWLGVMLVIVYIFAGAFLFSNWEGWNFLDSVYFCFITLTTIGFGDLVPAQEKKENAELSIALCSIYLLFGIALLAMSFNLVQEEVISNVKKIAKRLGILKDEDEEEEE